MSEPRQNRKWWRWLSFIATMFVCLMILGAAAAAIVVINRTEPTATQLKTTRKSAALVQTIIVKYGTYCPAIIVLGTVQPASDIVLGARVSGQVTQLSPKFVPGGMVQRGDMLLRIDPADFENALSINESELEQALASLQIEEGRQSLAKKELKLLESTIDDTNRSLVLRAPQIASIRAEVNAAKAAVEKAQLDLDRTKIEAPFDAQIISRSVNVGSQVTPGTELARLVGVDEYWITAAVPVRSLQWIQFPETDQPGSNVILRNPDAWPENMQRTGTVARMIAAVDQQTRLARVIITVDDPLGLQSDAPPLILESLIETEIAGRPIENVVRLPREYVRNQDTVWVMKDAQLQIREVDVVFRDATHAYIRDGLEDGDEVVISTLATVAEGVGLKRIETPDESDQSESLGDDESSEGEVSK